MGTWQGTGEGQFPTIAPFTYREILEVSEGQTETLLQYQQRSWRDKDSEAVASHMELGFIRLRDDESIDLLNVQGSDRVEVLNGAAVVRGGTLSIELNSVALAHDERMIRSWRKLQLDGDSLRYSMGMATRRVPEGALHLSANLTRQ